MCLRPTWKRVHFQLVLLLRGHALEFSVKVGLPGGRGNVAVLIHELTSTYFLLQLLQELFKSEKYKIGRAHV